MYYIIGVTPWNETEIKQVLKAETMQTFLAIKLTPHIQLDLKKCDSKKSSFTYTQACMYTHMYSHTDSKSTDWVPLHINTSINNIKQVLYSS